MLVRQLVPLPDRMQQRQPGVHCPAESSHRQAAVLKTPSYSITIMATTTELFSGIGDKNSSKVLAPPGGKSSIGFDAPAPAPIVPKNSASAQKAKDLSTNPLAPLEPSSKPATSTGAAGEKVQAAPEQVGEAARPRGVPNRARAPPGGHSQGSFW